MTFLRLEKLFQHEENLPHVIRPYRMREKPAIAVIESALEAYSYWVKLYSTKFDGQTISLEVAKILEIFETKTPRGSINVRYQTLDGIPVCVHKHEPVYKMIKQFEEDMAGKGLVYTPNILGTSAAVMNGRVCTIPFADIYHPSISISTYIPPREY